ncbi:hypothetical protein [Pontiella sulfatireligans]|uniref:Uncharacterized protein n=1 Tax=Pontiella sulfatireligans TaxID=2750658 RepID=A0A6C2UGJ3_9BACT|nr:hypothetical protein [Pontiella sulfatireligans]VGO19332.1 hypothetical protein SCARR_01390 [Pontiella sulfatireligans]
MKRWRWLSLAVAMAGTVQAGLLIGFSDPTTGDPVGGSSLDGFANSSGWSSVANDAQEDNSGIYGTGTAVSDAANSNDTSWKLFPASVGVTASIDFAVTNNTGSAVDLAWFVFRGCARKATAAEDYSVEILGGGSLTAGVIDSDTLPIAQDGYIGYDIDLSGLADRTLEDGGTATFRLSVSGNSGNASTDNTYIDNVAIAADTSSFAFNLNPNDSLTFESDYPATVSTNEIVASFIGEFSSVQIENLVVTSDSNEFSVLTSTPFTMNDPNPSNALLKIEFDATLAGPIGPAVDAWSTTGSVDVVWTEVGNGTMNTNEIELIGRFRNPAVGFEIDSSLVMSLGYPDTAVTNDLTVSYDQGRPGHTNVQITAINILDASTNGFSTTTSPFTLTDPAPSNSTISIVFDNSGGQLGSKDTATANVEVVWGELGGSTNYTETVPVSVQYVNLPQGVMQLLMANPIVGVDEPHGSPQALNDFGLLTNKWYGQNISYNTDGYLKQTSGTGNNRSSFNIIESGTAGQDNFGPVDTVALTNGLYRYDFVYEVISNSTPAVWSIDAYALVGQEAFSVSNNTDYVSQDPTTGNVEYNGPVGHGTAYPEQHPSGSLRGSNAVSKTTGSVYLNVQDGMDAMFHLSSSGAPEIRLYELTLTREGEYDPNAEDPNPPNSVIAADFSDLSATNSIFAGLDQTDTNTNGVNNTWRGTLTSWESQALKSVAGDLNSKATAIITRSGTSGYDDVGVQDTIPLTSGEYELTLDIDITGGFPSNESVVRVEFYALSQDSTGNVNQVRIKHTENALLSDYMIADGTAAFTLLGSKTYTANVTEKMTLSGMPVQDGQDVALVFYHAFGPDLKIDNVLLVRTGDVVLSGYDGWASGFTGFFDTALDSDPDGDDLSNLMEYALNGDPTDSGDAASIKPVVSTVMDGGSNWLYHVHNERTDDGTLSYVVEAGNNLVFTNWNSAGIEFVDESASVGNYKSVTNRTDTDASAEFIRLQVEK